MRVFDFEHIIQEGVRFRSWVAFRCKVRFGSINHSLKVLDVAGRRRELPEPFFCFLSSMERWLYADRDLCATGFGIAS